MQQIKVCVADDCVDEANILCDGLRLHNYEAVAVHNGHDALEACRRGDVHLVLLDVGMPGMSGYEVCSQLKADKNTQDIPVVFVTAKDSAEDVSTGYALGAVDYIAKPYNLPIIMVRVDCIMRTHQFTDYARANQELLCDMAYTDELTGLRNRRFLLERLQEEVEKAHRYDYPVSCMVVDVDDITAIDKDFGPITLDDWLVEMAIAMRNTSRNYDILARFDSSMFAAVLPHAMLSDAVSYANKIQEEIAATAYSDPCLPSKAKLSFSIVSCRNGSAQGADKVLGEAMRGLFRAKSKTGERIFARDLNANG